MTTTQLLLLFAFSAGLELGGAARVGIRGLAHFANENVTAEGDSVHLGIHAGRILNRRFRLESLLESQPPPWGMQPMAMPMAMPMWQTPMLGQVPMMGGFDQFGLGQFGGGLGLGQFGGALHQHPVPDEKPGETFPEGTEFSDKSLEHLGAGQFGDVWKATDLETGEYVAVKVFYRHTQDGGKEYLTWNTADEPNREEMKKNIRECELVRDIIGQGENIYPIGANRICKCEGEFITQGMEDRDNVMYTVWEMCGTSMTDLRTELGTFRAIDRKKAARLMTKQVLEAINLFSMYDPPLIHHDLKADNAVVLGSLKEGYQVKLIDFGCFVKAAPGNQHSQSIGDPSYMPPEHSVQSNAFSDPPSSFDIYGIGLIHMELLCPALELGDWSPAHRTTQQMMLMGQKKILRIERVEFALKERCPELFSEVDITADLDLIKKLIPEDPGERLLPGHALEHHAMVSAVTVNTAIPMQFAKGQEVEYYAASYKKWLPCFVGDVHVRTGTYDLYTAADANVTFRKQQIDPSRVRTHVLDQSKPLRISVEMPVVSMVFKVGDKVEYFQQSANQWVECIVSGLAQLEGTDRYELSLVDGTPYRQFVRPESVRAPHFPRGTKVLAYGSLRGTVHDYDAAGETYDILQEGSTTEYYRRVPRDFVAVSEAVPTDTTSKWVEVAKDGWATIAEQGRAGWANMADKFAKIGS